MRRPRYRRSDIASLLATTALCAVLVSGAGAATSRPAFANKGHYVQRTIRPSSAVTLYDQTANDSGISIVSQNFESSFDAYDCEAADDFVVPDGAKWRVTEIDILGTTFNGSGVAESETLFIYKDKNGKPGKTVAEYDGHNATETFGPAIAELTPPARLRPGQ